jgi:hypothetical protein
MSQGRVFFAVMLLCVFAFGFGVSLHAQSGNFGSIQGIVTDPSGAAVPGATVEIRNPVSGYDHTTSSGSDGHFSFSNVPLNPYQLTVVATGFQSYVQDVDVRSAVAVSANVALKIGGASTAVVVEADAGDLVENDPVTHTDVDRDLFDKLPLESQSSSVSSLVTLATPGIAADSNGLFHGLGDHASNSFSIDGQPISDQQSKVFSNQIPEDSIQSLEVIEGAPPAEYGDKTSVVIAVTTRSGLGVTEPHGSVTTSYGSFGSSNLGFNLSYGGTSWGNFISASGLNTDRFLDGPELAVMHDRGNEENFFDRLDFKLSPADTISVNLGYSRSWFQTPNSYDAEDATAWEGLVVPTTCPGGQIGNCGGLGSNGLAVGIEDQRSKIGTFNIAPSWTHVIDANTLFTVGVYVRRDQYNYYPSADPFADLTPDLQLQTIGQDRSLTNAGVRASYSYVKGINNLKAGLDYSQTFLDEADTLGIVDPTANAVCLYGASGLPDTNPLLTNPSACTGTLVANSGQGVGLNGGSLPAFNPLLACYDLTRTAALPGSDDCPKSTSGEYTYDGRADIRELALYIEDSITKRNWTFNLGMRGDLYRGISNGSQLEPRLGIAYNIKRTSSVLQVSYARTLETPFNENLVLASLGCNDAVISAIMASTISPCVTTTPLSPGWRNEFHAGLQQAFGRYFVLNGEYIWKYTHKAYDFSVLGDSPITFPIEWDRSKIPGFAVRGTVPNVHGFTAYVVLSHVAARFFEPQTHVQYQPWKRGPWIGVNWRYDSGLVAGPVPCAGGEDCANGPNGTDSVVDVSALSPDQQFQAGLYCGSVHATPTTPISSNLGADLCPAAEYGSPLLVIPAAGTENDDHNPPRIAPRSLFDASIGDDNLFHRDRYMWSLRFTVINLTNKVALYNFLSTFSGTHYVSPRTETAELGFHF